MEIKNNESIDKLSEIISEILRNEKNKKGITYIDVDNNLNKIINKTNHVIFGRRGAGKSTLIFETQNKINSIKPFSYIYIDAEEYKNHSFPKVIIEIFIKILSELDDAKGLRFINKIKYFFSSERRSIKKTIGELEDMFNNDIDKKSYKIEASDNSELNIDGDLGKTSGKITKAQQKKQSSTEEVNYLTRLNLLLPRLKKTLNNIIEIKGYDSIFIFFDDFYHLPLSKQAEILDFIHRLAKNIKITFKISTIKHRAILYKPTGEGYYGIQEGQDYESIDLDKTFERFQDTKIFLENMFKSLLEKVGIEDIKEIFAGESFNYLVLGSGGVPRDFLNLFNTVLNTKNKSGKIKKTNILNASASLISTRKEDFQDNKKESKNLFKLFNNICSFCLETKKRTVFAISDNDKDLIDKINKLVDFKLFHTVLRNTSHTKYSGEKYTYYILDLGLYSKRSLTKDFKGKGIYEVNIFETNEKQKLDNIRTAPIYSLS